MLQSALLQTPHTPLPSASHSADQLTTVEAILEPTAPGSGPAGEQRAGGRGRKWRPGDSCRTNRTAGGRLLTHSSGTRRGIPHRARAPRQPHSIPLHTLQFSSCKPVRSCATCAGASIPAYQSTCPPPRGHRIQFVSVSLSHLITKFPRITIADSMTSLHHAARICHHLSITLQFPAAAATATVTVTYLLESCGNQLTRPDSLLRLPTFWFACHCNVTAPCLTEEV